MSKSYACLYTKHKTQKRKKWNDGKLIVNPSGLIHLFPCAHDNTSIIQSSANATLDTLVVSLDQVNQLASGVVTDLEMDKFLIEIESEWKPQPIMTNSTNSRSSNAKTTGSNTNTLIGKKRSNGMQKLLINKFRKPAKYIPKPNQQQHHPGSTTTTRKRPLQPGQYLRQFHGTNGNTNGYNGNVNANGYNQNGNGNVNGMNANRNYSHANHHHSIPGHSHHHASNNSTRTNNGNVSQHNQNNGYGPQHGFGATTTAASPQHAMQVQQQQPQNPYQYVPTNTRPVAVRPQGVEKTRNQFTSNDFDPNSFYDEDDNEEECHEQGDQKTVLENHGENTNALNWNDCLEQQQQQQQHEEQSLQPPERNVMETNTDTGTYRQHEQEQNDATMTNSDLLQLFCGGGNDGMDTTDTGKIENHDVMDMNDNGKTRVDDAGESDELDDADDRDADDDDANEEDKDGTEDEYPPSSDANNPFLEGLLRSEAELDQNANANANVNMNANMAGDFEEDTIRSGNEEDDGDDSWNGVGDDHDHDKGQVKDPNPMKDNEQGDCQSDSSEDDGDPISFDINIPDNDSDSSVD